MSDHEKLQGYLTELRRGSLTLAVLGCLQTPHYGYALLQALQERHVDIEANTLYPLLRRLESQGLLTSDWDTGESRPRKYYSRNAEGDRILLALLGEWRTMQAHIEAICGKDESHEKLD